MKIFSTIRIFILISLVFACPAFAQTNEQIERELVGHLQNIEKWSGYGEGSDAEALGKENEMLAVKLLKYTKSASTLQYSFAALDEHLHIATSSDGRFRIYSWDRRDGGTMRNFSRVYQYIGANEKVYSKPDDYTEGDAGSFVYDIFTLDTRGGKVYLVCSNAILSTAASAQTVRLYKISGASLADEVKLIKTRSGLTDSVVFDYDFFSIAEGTERPVRLISFDQKTKTLRIPVIIEDAEFPNGRVTGRFISYRFNGTYFVKMN